MVQRSNRAGAMPPAKRDAAAIGNTAASGGRHGQALRIPLDLIDEDPDQPRSVFDDAALQTMAESIRMHGVVQPIGVRACANGRYLLAFGARRLRASMLAGMADIPAVVWHAQGDEFAAQIIENQHRSNLTNSDLATAIARLTAEGSTIREIAAICSLKDYQVTVFRQAENFPPALRERMNNADMRALYDLYRQWTRTPEALLAALPYRDAFITVTDARRIVGELTGKPTGSIVLERERIAAQRLVGDAPLLGELADALAKSVPQHQSGRAEKAVERTSHSRHQAVDAPLMQQRAPASSQGLDVSPLPHLPVFIVTVDDGPFGRLVLDRKAQHRGHALVSYGSDTVEVDILKIRLVGVR